MKIQEVILRVFARKIAGIEATEILGRSPRQDRRMKSNYEKHGFHALFDDSLGKASPNYGEIDILAKSNDFFSNLYRKIFGFLDNKFYSQM